MVIEYLSEIFTKQRVLQKIIQRKNPTRHIYKTEEPFLGYRIFFDIEAIEEECKEIKRETGWKWWKQEKDKLDMDHIKEEVSDILFFTIKLCLDVGLEPPDLYKEYLKKLKTNEQRQENNY